MSLSEFRVHLLNCDGEALECVQIKFVKEFIKKLKLGLHNIILDCPLVEEIIDELAGKELTKWKPQKKLETD